MIGHETRGKNRRGRIKPEVDMIDQKLQHHLILVVAAGHADAQARACYLRSTSVGDRVIRGRLPGSITLG